MGPASDHRKPEGTKVNDLVVAHRPAPPPGGAPASRRQQQDRLRPDAGAKARARLRRAGELAEDPDYLVKRSISTETRARYETAVGRLCRWCAASGENLEAKARLDHLLARYVNHLFFLGRGVSEARYAVWGLAFLRGFVVAKAHFPRVTLAFRGWKRAAPDRPRDPMPWDALLQICRELVKCRYPAWRSRALLAARALPIQWDGYMRPSEVLELGVGDLHPPYRSTDAWAVVVRSAPEVTEGSPRDLRDALAGRPRAKPTKTGELDGTVLIPDGASAKAGRAWLSEHLRRASAAAVGARLFPLAVVDYNHLIQWAARECGLADLGLCAHSARHGGPSHDAACGARTLDEIQARGQWAMPRSVARYRKAGQLRRQENRLTIEQRADAKSVARNPLQLLWAVP